MDKATKKAVFIDQTRFCACLMDRLHESTREWVEADCPDWAIYGSGLKEDGATKTQIRQDIVRLRRELNKLSRMVG